MKRILIVTALVLAGGAAPGAAQDLEREVTKSGTTSADFLNIPVGAPIPDATETSRNTPPPSL